MKIIVPVRQTPDPLTPVRLNAETGQPDAENLSLVLNPYDAVALEAALQLSEKQAEEAQGIEIVAVSIAEKMPVPVLQQALAMGADRAVHIQLSEGQAPSSQYIAMRLAAFVRREQADLVLVGEQETGLESGQLPPRLAGVLDWPQAISVETLSFAGEEANRQQDGTGLIAGCHTSKGVQQKCLQLPAVIAADLALAKPRFVRLPQLIKAKRKPVEKLAVQDLLVVADHMACEEETGQVKTVGWQSAPKRPASQRLESVEALFSQLAIRCGLPKGSNGGKAGE